MNSIAVVVPVFNQDEFIFRCIKSVLNQSFKDYVLILVDDGSTDQSAAICDRYLIENENVFVIHEKNKGLSAARNAGIDLVSKCNLSNWITFIDSDDWVNNRYFEYMLDTANNKKVSVVASDYIRTDLETQLSCDNPEVSLCTPEEFICSDRTLFSVACCKLYSISCFDSIRFPVGKYHEDEYTTYKILFEYERIARIQFPLYNYYVNADSITQSEWSPKRLDAVEAMALQMDYFKTNSYSNAFFSSLNCYLWLLYDFSKESRREYPILANQLKHRFIKEFKKYKETFPITEYGYFYSYAFPIRYRLYLYCNKIKSILFGSRKKTAS